MDIPSVKTGQQLYKHPVAFPYRSTTSNATRTAPPPPPPLLMLSLPVYLSASLTSSPPPFPQGLR